jgi:ParB-like chromosome segregation protein Spo0J
MKIEEWVIDKLIPYARNPRKNDPTVDGLASSIKEFGFRQPIVVDKDGVIVVGHTRYLAAKKLGLAKVPVHVAKDLTPERAKAYRIVDNKIQEKSKWDYELLQLELSEMDLTTEPITLSFDKSELDVIMQAEWKPDAPEEGFEKEEKAADVEVNIRPIIVTAEQRETVDRAIERCREMAEDRTISEGRCIELICADYCAS